MFADLVHQGVIGSWKGSLPHEQNCAIQALCSLEQDDFPLEETTFQEFLAHSILTAKGAWAIAQTLQSSRYRDEKFRINTQQPHINVRKWLSGDFTAKNEEMDVSAKLFIYICRIFSTLGWYKFQRRIPECSDTERKFLRSLHESGAEAFPPKPIPS